MNLLRSHQVGRVVYSDGAIPVGTPVNYIFDGGAVVFRTHPGSRLAKAIGDTVLSFQVDEVEVDTASGWPVIVIGVGQVLGGLDLLQAEHGPLVSWAGDDRTHLVRIPASLVSGCRVGSRLGGEHPALPGGVGSQVESLVTPPG